MTKNVKKATPEFATSQTIVWWDMDSCPLPNGYDPSRVGPRIDTELKNLGYNSRLTIGIGNLEGVPLDFLKALSSGGVVIKQLSLGNKSNLSL
uniref:NYN domain-containing protein n=1 Tax=Brassica oleracea var. oleracea TaxID=109376 RepID=A0A0D3AFT0_BRAOL